MLRKTCVVAAVAAAVSLFPLGAFAQQMPTPADGTSINEPPAAGAQAAVDACGNTPQSALGATTPQGTPLTVNDGNPKDVGAAQQRQDMSSVAGFVVHTAGDLVLLQIPWSPRRARTIPQWATGWP